MLRNIMRLWQQFLLFTGRNDPTEPEYNVTLVYPDVQAVHDRLWEHGWGINDMSLAYRRQVLTMRKLPDMQHQYHMRMFDDGCIQIHYEPRWDTFPWEHEHGTSRPLTSSEKAEFIKELTGA